MLALACFDLGVRPDVRYLGACAHHRADGRPAVERGRDRVEPPDMAEAERPQERRVDDAYGWSNRLVEGCCSHRTAVRQSHLQDARACAPDLDLQPTEFCCEADIFA